MQQRTTVAIRGRRLKDFQLEQLKQEARQPNCVEVLTQAERKTDHGLRALAFAGTWPRGAMTLQISASLFKARCLGLMDQVAATGEVLVITKNGRPVA